MRLAAIVAVLVALAPAAPARAEPAFRIPLDCRLGETCWLMNHMDARRGPGMADFRCGARAYDGHDGTDFAVRDGQADMAVVAPADGTVVATRDGAPDGSYVAKGKDAVAGRECGNGVLIRHGGGWETQLCHLRRGSVAVKPGQAVAAGTVLGRVGLSGMSAFPHVHLTIRRDGKAVDPFTGTVPQTCGEAGTPLWAEDLPYQDGALYAVGFRAALPKAAALKRDASSPATLPAGAPALVLWGTLFGTEPGDRVRLVLSDAGGRKVVERVTDPLPKPQAWRFEATGIKAPAAGAWHGRVELLRGGRVIAAREARVEVTR